MLLIINILYFIATVYFLFVCWNGFKLFQEYQNLKEDSVYSLEEKRNRLKIEMKIIRKQFLIALSITVFFTVVKAFM